MSGIGRIECRLVLRGSDFIVGNHRVHAVPTLPGVALLDIICRILAARGADAGSAAIRGVLFSRPITTADGADREVLVDIGAQAHGGQILTARSRPLLPSAQAPWEDNLSAELAFGPQDREPRLAVAALKADFAPWRTMTDIYAQARAEGIEHGAPMTCHGTIYHGRGGLLAELDLDPAAARAGDAFHIHPAVLDAATLIGFGRTPLLGQPFIPMFLDEFRAPRQLTGSCYVHVPDREVLAESADVVRNSFTLYDAQGEFVARFDGLTCKRIRFPELITRDLGRAPRLPRAMAGPDPAPAPELAPPRAAALPSPAREHSPAEEAAMADRVRALVAAKLERPAARVDTSTGFYDLGLDSVALVDLSRELEDVVGEQLYPTLLFEFGNVDRLARHLASRYRLAEPGGAAEPAQEPELMCSVPVWHPVPIRPVPIHPVPIPGTGANGPGDLLIVGAEEALIAHLRRRAAALGRRVVSVAADGDSAGRDQLRAALAELDAAHVILMTRPDTGFLQTWALAAALHDADPGRPRELRVAHRDADDLECAALGGLLRTICAETPALHAAAVGFDPAMRPPALADLLLAESALPPEPSRQVRHRAGRREALTWRVKELPPEPAPPLRDEGVYVVTGGGGALGRLLTDMLVRSYRARVGLIGRREPDEALLSALRRWHAAGAEVEYVAADIAAARAADAVARLRDRFGRLDGVFHCAGSVDDALYPHKHPARMARVLDAKIRGAVNLDEATRPDKLDVFVLFSSLSASVPNPGQCDYAYANAFLEHFAQWRARRADRTGRTIAIAWPYWAEGGMRVCAPVLEHARRTDGTAPLPTEAGLDALLRALTGSDPVVLVGYGEPAKLRRLAPFSDLRDRAKGEAGGESARASRRAPAPPGRQSEVRATSPDGALKAPGGERENIPIAIVGVAGRYPQADDLDRFWANLAAGRDCVTEVPSDRWDAATGLDPASGEPGRGNGRWGGFLSEADRFDRAFFGISRRDAERMDPQERLFLQTCWAAVEDAGYRADRPATDPVGVFVGVMWNHYQLVGADEPGTVTPSALHASIANRVSYHLNLTGPSLAVDTACSSSLVAMHLAAESIRRGECVAALAGGVNITTHPQKYLQLGQDGFLSADGRCRSFGAGGTGYVPGEGVGAVLLKPLAAALADGDHIYAVLRGSWVNNNGRTAGVTVPDPASQADVIRAALRRAGVDPATLGYIEAHGTGTALGDPIEFEALTRVLTEAGMSRASCPIGSVKSNIGHLEGAAGIAAVTKVLLQFRHRALAPSLHADEPNPHLDLAASPLRLQRRLEQWPTPTGGPRRAGISSFGAGGTNAHLVLEEAPLAGTPPARTGSFLFVLSARDREGLRRYARSVLDSLDGSPAATIDEICHTCQVGRTPLAVRLALVVTSTANLREGLNRYLAGEVADLLFTSGITGPVPGAPPARDEAARAISDGRPAELAGLAGHWVQGADIAWDECYPRRAEAAPPRRASLPTYPFAGERCWLGRWHASRPGPPPAAQLPEPATRQDGPVVDYRVLDGAIALIAMCDAAGRNMFSDELLRGLQGAFAQADQDDSVRAVVVTGTERVFSMGGTAQALEQLAAREGSFTDVPFVYEGLLRCRRPVISAIRGQAFGGGLAFGLYADIVVMSTEGGYSANFLSYGFTPGMGATYILGERLGPALAQEMLYTARVVGGDELERRGAQAVFRPDAQVLPTALDLARAVAAQPLPASVAALKTEFASRTLGRVRAVVGSEDRMHQAVLGPDALAHVRTHFAKVQGFRATSASAPQADGDDAAVAVPSAGPAPADPPSAAEPAGRRDDVVRAIESVLCEQLFLDRHEIGHELSFHEMGVDSLGAVEIARGLAGLFGVSLDSVAIYDHPTVPRLADAVVELMSGAERLAAAAATPSAARTVALTPLASAPPQARVADGAADPASAIAVIGMAGRFPDAPDLHHFWSNLLAGHSAVTQVPWERWDAGAVFAPGRTAPGRTYSRWGAFLADIDEFDAAFFRISPTEATAMDPQQRLFLQEAWKALEEAGYAISDAGRRSCGVFVGCSAGDYHQVAASAGNADTPHEFLGDSPSILAARIAFALDLSGPTVALDTACSSSLVAVHLAAEAIRSGECDMALAGGVALMVTPQLHIRSSKVGMLSPTGRSAPFSAEADGIVLGEGAGVVVLKRLDRALADADHIHGVLLASGTNGDGRTNAITAPSAVSQAELLRRVRERAGLRAEDIGYVETHGTGTPLGDPIEFKALRAAFGPAPDGRCALGSVKANIGHTTMAAGIAGLIKTLLVVRHGVVPPQPGLDRLNPEIDLAGSGFTIPTRVVQWESVPGRPRVGAVSSFGFSGTNCHVILAEPPGRPPDSEAAARRSAAHMVPVSARTDAALRRLLANLADALTPDHNLFDVAYTLTAARTHHPVRAALVAADIAQLRDRLREAASAPDPRARGHGEDGGLGHDQAEGYLSGQAPAWTLPPGRRLPLPTYPFERRRHWADPTLRWEIAPSSPVVAEHVVDGTPVLPGAAFVAAVTRFALDTGSDLPLRLASVRWRRPLRIDHLRRVLVRSTGPASGESGTAVELAEADGGEPFATAVLTPVQVKPGDSAAAPLDLDRIRARLTRHITGDELYRAFAAAGIAYGPRFRLLDYVACAADEGLARLVPLAAGCAERREPVPAELLDAAMQAAAVLMPGSGAALPFAADSIEVYAAPDEAACCHVTATGDAYRVDVADCGGRLLLRVNGLLLRRPEPAGDPVAELIYVPAWRDVMPPTAGGSQPSRILIAHAPAGARLAASIVAAIRSAHPGAGVAAAGLDGLAEMLDQQADPGMAEAVDQADTVYVVAGPADPKLPPERDQLLAGVFWLLRRLPSREPRTVKVVLSGAVCVDDEPFLPHHAPVIGLARTFGAERQQWRVSCIDVGLDAEGAAGDSGLAARIVAEDAGQPLVALRGAGRLTRAFLPAGLARPADVVYRPGGVYLLVGGAGGIGFAVSKHLASQAGARLVWLGRRAEDDAIRALMAQIVALGGDVVYCQGDVTDPAAVRTALDLAASRFGRVNGAFHAAVTLADRALANLVPADFDAVLAPKIAGSLRLAEALADHQPDFLVLFSSAAAFVDCPGQGNYAAASTGQDALGTWIGQRYGIACRVIDWGYWGSVGIVADHHHRSALSRIGVGSIEPDEGVDVIDRVLAAGARQVLAVKAGAAGLAHFAMVREPAAPARQALDLDLDLDLERARAGFDHLETVSRAAAVACFQGLPAVPPPGQTVPVDRLASELGVALPMGRRLLDAFLKIGERAGALTLDAGSVTVLAAGGVNLRDRADELVAHHPEMAPHLRLLRNCVDALPRVLAGTRSGVDVLFPKGSAELVEAVYRGQPLTDHYARLLAGRVTEAVARSHATGPVRILEVGAGTGAGTLPALQACDRFGNVEYWYTDISAAFVKHGETTLAARYPFLRFAPLDIERDPAGQGFAEGGYDVVVATNVLHATADLRCALGHILTLLRPGGLLAFNEVTAASDFLTLTFGLTSGWWRSADTGRLAGGPLASVPQWRAALLAAGFEAVGVDGVPGAEADDLDQAVITARRPRGEPAALDPDALLGYVRRVFCDVLRYRASDLDEHLTFDHFGVDSLVSLQIVERFERDLGELPATLLFEHLTIAALAEHLGRTYGAKLGSALGEAERTEPAQAPATATPHDVPHPALPPDGAGDIAIIGVTGRYPGAPDVAAFWRNLEAGRRTLTEIPASRWDWRVHFDSRRGTPGRSYGRWGGFIDGVADFDAGFFGILPRDARHIDPQERLFLEHAWLLLDGCGYLDRRTREPSTGVFAGLMYGTYGQLGATRWAAGELAGANSAYWSVANRVSYFFDFTGPSLAVDSACSSSLTAVHLACESLRRGECAMAIAGGVNLLLHPAHLVSLSALNMLSSNGEVKVFDQRADGFVPGEGVGAVLLKPLAAAVADGDEIWAVVKASAVNAGGRTSGYTVPNPNAQADVVAAALRRGGIRPGSVGYVEAHGTGTALGDPIELAGLARVFGARDDSPDAAAPGRHCAIGSVKANIGHLEGAAGIAGLTKALLQLRHGRIAPTPGIETLNPRLNTGGAAFHIPREAIDWPAPGPDGTGLRRAGVSSFGAGGANAHIVIEEYRMPERAARARGDELFLLSARSRDELHAYAERVASWLAAMAGTAAMAELAYTSQVGRAEFAYRLAIRAADPRQLADRLRAFCAGAQDADAWYGAGTDQAGTDQAGPDQAGPDQAGPDQAGTDQAGTGQADRPAWDEDRAATLIAARDLAALADLWVTRGDVDWRPMWPDPAPRRTPLPPYPFARTRYWLDTGDQDTPDGSAAGARQARAGAGELTVAVTPHDVPAAAADPGHLTFLRQTWQPRPLASAERRPRHVLVICDAQRRALWAAEFGARGIACTIATPGPGYASAGVPGVAPRGQHSAGVPGVAPRGQHSAGEHGYTFLPGRDEHCKLLAADLAGRGTRPDAVLFEACASGFDPRPLRLDAQVDRAFGAAFGFAAALLASAAQDATTPLRFVYAYRAGQGSPHDEAMSAALRTLALEHTGFRGTCVGHDGEGAADVIVAELLRGDDAADVMYTGGERRARELAEYRPAQDAITRTELPIRRDGVYLITGGAGGLGLRFARLLAAGRPAHIVLAGRSQIGDRLDAVGAPDGTCVRYIQADVGEWSEVRRLVAEIEAQCGPLRGVLHAAGVTRDARALTKTREQIREVLRAKVSGAVHLDAATAGQPLDFLVLFGSLAAATGNLGQVDYAYANAFLDRFAIARQQWSAEGLRPGRTVAIGWPLWRDGGMGVDAATEKLMARRWGMIPMSEEAGFAIFTAALAGTDPVVYAVQTAPAVPPAGQDPAGIAEADLRRRAADFLLVQPDDVDVRADLGDLGFDSIAFTELTNWINERYDLDLLPTVLFEHPTLRDLADHLGQAHGSSVARAGQGGRPREAAACDLGPPAADQAEIAATDIAIIGMAGTFPGSPDLDAFWRHLEAGDDLVGPAPADRADLLADPRTRSMQGGFLDRVAGFDAALFGVAPREAALMDPQQRLVLQAAWSAVADAGYRPADLAGSSCGVFVGVSTRDYDELITRHGLPVDAHMATGSSPALLANRVSHVFDLRGPSEAVDTACSSALVAVHRAMGAVRSGECALALAGAVNVVLNPGLSVAFAASGMLSASGRCRTFDADADGYVRGEGVGVVLLKPLAQAVADGDHVHAVLKGSAVNHCGRSVSLTAPNPLAQAAVIVAAHRAAGSPTTVTYLEAHGTGTRLGDPAEVEGIKHALAELGCLERGSGAADVPLAVGTVKSVIGHLEAAAGMAGLLKVVLSLRHGRLPATLHVKTRSPLLRLDGTRLVVNDHLSPWTGASDSRGRMVRRAGVSAFGFGGTNAHVVVEDAPSTRADAPGQARGAVPVVLSARNEAALLEYASRVADWLDGQPAASLEGVAFTTQTGRDAFGERLAVVTDDMAELAAALRAFARGERTGATLRGSAAADTEPAEPGADARTVAARWVAGAEANWVTWWGDRPPRRVSLPAMPLAPTDYWLPAAPAAQPVQAIDRAETGKLRLRARDARPPADAVTENKAGAEDVAPAVRPVSDAPAASQGQAPGDLAELIRIRLAAILGVPAGGLDADQGFDELGLDSIFRMELARTLGEALSLELRAADLYDHACITELAAFLAGQAGTGLVGTGLVGTGLVGTGQVSTGQEAAARTALERLITSVAGRTLDADRTFADNGLTSFDMLRVVGALERSLGGQRKTLLFDHPTIAELTAFLCAEYGAADVADVPGTEDTGDADNPPAGQCDLLPVPAVDEGDAPTILRRSELAGLPRQSVLVRDLEGRHGMETGLAGRDIAPLIFIGAKDDAFFSFSRYRDSILAWSYVGPSDCFATLAGQWVRYARRHGLNASFLSLTHLTEADGEALTCTPFGVVQRLPDLRSFALDGGRMSRLRYMVRRFERLGEVRTVEHRGGADPRACAQIAGLVDQWAASKPMVNPYVARVREELREGRLAERHRVFLTYLDGRLENAIVVTRLPSQPGYLLDAEFYGPDMPLGGLEAAIVRILRQLAAEGCTVFSFGASFGARRGDARAAAPEAVRALDEMQSAGIFAAGNYQFKSKFRPTEEPIYLCQPRDGRRTQVADVVLMIANPQVPARLQVPAEPGKPAGSPRALARTTDRPRREALLREHGYNPLRIPQHAVEIDLLTDSWAERGGSFIDQRMTDLAEAVTACPDAPDEVDAPWLPFPFATLTPSGRAAEALLCRAWPGRRGRVLHNTLFPTWTFSLADSGFIPTAVAGAPGSTDPDAWWQAMRADGPPVSFACLELAGNAGAGLGPTLEELRAVKTLLDAHGIPLILDATRALDNALQIIADGAGRDPWEVVHELLVLADAATISLSKNFAVATGGLLAVGAGDTVTELASRVRDDVAARGSHVSLRTRQMLVRALTETGAGTHAGPTGPMSVACLVRARAEAVGDLARGLKAAGAPVVGRSSPRVGTAHCVLLDPLALSAFARLPHPTATMLAWLYRHAGVRGAPHLVPSDHPFAGYVRLAAPVGVDLSEAAQRLVALFEHPPEPVELVATGAARGHGDEASYFPAGELPGDLRESLAGGHAPPGENFTVLCERAPRTRRHLVRHAGGVVEAFSVGDGPPVLLMHPFNIGAGMFAEQFRDLAGRNRLIAIHHPGVGATTAARDLSLAGICALHLAVLAELGVREPVHVVGTSVGGILAINFALAYPRDTASLTVICGSYRYANRHGEVNRLEQVVAEDCAAIARAGDAGAQPRDHGAAAGLLLRCESMDPHIGLRYLDFFAGQPDLLGRLPDVKAPALVVQGRHDTVIPLKTAHTLHALIPDSRYIELPDAGHFPCVTHPDEVRAALRAFFDEVAQEPSRAGTGRGER